ncbi:MAG TPA: DNA alkylation repair protein, partial [Candidatus Thermoplasmatota archaeon]|nr:DNA alkylation repair protein [Candidatus Thermoplasmatota archaeon]
MARADGVLAELRALGSERDRAGMARFGIATGRAFGVSVAKLRSLAKRLGRDHALARDLWRTGVHEARILAAFVEEPARVTPAQMERLAKA